MTDRYICISKFSQIDHFVQKILHVAFFVLWKNLLSANQLSLRCFAKNHGFLSIWRTLLLFKSLKVNNNKNKKGLNDINT